MLHSSSLIVPVCLVQCGGGSSDTLAHLCVTTPSASRASVDEILILLPTFLISVVLLSAVTRSASHSTNPPALLICVRSDLFLKLFLFLSVQRPRFHLYCSTDGGCTPACRPPPLLIVELRKAGPAQQIVWRPLFLYPSFHLFLIYLLFFFQRYV